MDTSTANTLQQSLSVLTSATATAAATATATHATTSATHSGGERNGGYDPDEVLEVVTACLTHPMQMALYMAAVRDITVYSSLPLWGGMMCVFKIIMLISSFGVFAFY